MTKVILEARKKDDFDNPEFLGEIEFKTNQEAIEFLDVINSAKGKVSMQLTGQIIC